MRNSAGALMSKVDKLHRVLTYAQDVFAQYTDLPQIQCLSKDLAVSDTMVQAELKRLGAAKAVPSTAAPAATWKSWKRCFHSPGQVLGPALRAHFSAGSSAILEQELRDASVSLIPKPNKPATDVANLRPIGLQCPSAKVVAGLIRQQVIEVLDPWIQQLPQYASPDITTTPNVFEYLLRLQESLHVAIAALTQQENPTHRPRPRTNSLAQSVLLLFPPTVLVASIVS